MVFSSLLFLIFFLPLTAILYYIIPSSCKNVLLLVVSLVFYAWGEPVYIVLMLLTTLYIWFLTICMDKAITNNHHFKAKCLLILCIVFSLGILGIYKYTGFLLDIFPIIEEKIGIIDAPPLPIGISFYTFQALSYVMDVYRRDVKVQKSWIDFTMYISLFPQLIAGPIVRYVDVEKQLDERIIDWKDIYHGIIRFIVGLGKKVLLANQVGVIWNEISELGVLSTMSAWIGAFAFFFQIYFDFSGYSDMAIGMGKMLGFQFTENFDYPYEAKSITEFWRRWHITLGTWFREYVYIPLGGNRKGTPRMILNLFIVWLLTGLWHGADWQFILWGIYYFVFLVIEKIGWIKCLQKLPKKVQHFYTIIIVVIGWVMFACNNMSAAIGYYKAMLGMNVSLIDDKALFYMYNNGILFLILCIGVSSLPQKLYIQIKKWIKPKYLEVVVNIISIFTLWISVAFLMADTYNPFLYFRF